MGFCQQKPVSVRRGFNLYKQVKTGLNRKKYSKCGPMPNVMAALPNIGGAVCPTPLSLADAHAPLVECRAVTLPKMTRNPVKFIGVPQTTGPISAATGPKFTILWEHVEEILLLNKFYRLSIRALVVKIWPNKDVRWCPDGEFLAIFWVLHFQRATCSTFQTCILNSH